MNTKKIKLVTLLSLITIGSIACSSSPKTPPTQTQIEERYVTNVNQGVNINYSNQLSFVNVSLDSQLANDEADLAQIGFTTDRLQKYLTNNTLNAGLYSPKSNTGLSLNVLITKARIRGEFGAKNFSLIDGSDYINALVTVTDKTGNAVSSAKITTPNLKSCPVSKVSQTNDAENDYVRNCGTNARISILNQYLADYTIDFIRGRF